MKMLAPVTPRLQWSRNQSAAEVRKNSTMNAMMSPLKRSRDHPAAVTSRNDHVRTLAYTASMEPRLLSRGGHEIDLNNPPPTCGLQ